ncbi:hypothetical protein AC624_13800 [Bacillus sp. FJAT-27238]|nr:hypothetical protein AC624_13800 [Bacillus sp. FJAT-27238]
MLKKVALVVEEAHFQSTLRPPPRKGYNCPLRNKWRERFKPENARAFLYEIKAEIPAIYYEAGRGSRGAWTGNALLLRGFFRQKNLSLEAGIFC